MLAHVGQNVSTPLLKQFDERIAQVPPEILRVPAIKRHAQFGRISDAVAGAKDVFSPALQRHLPLVQPIGKALITDLGRFAKQTFPEGPLLVARP
jgi:hypothetical protein